MSKLKLSNDLSVDNVIESYKRRGYYGQQLNAIRQKLWKEMFWSRSFCLLSSGGSPIETIRQYIENQGDGNDY